MRDWLHENAKNNWHWVGLDFGWRLFPFILLFFLGYLGIPAIRPKLYLRSMHFYGWVFTLLVCLCVMIWGVYKHRIFQKNNQLKLGHHHYKHLTRSRKKNIWFFLYQNLISPTVTSLFCILFIPAILLHYSPFPAIFTLFLSALAYPLQYILLQGHSGRHFFWQFLLCLWILFIISVLQSVWFLLLFCFVLSFSHVYAHKALSNS